MSAPSSLRVQNGCYNCGHCFVLHEYDESPRYFCGQDGQPRPKSLSVAMGECPNNIGGPDWDVACDAWDHWSEDREIRAWCICDHWKQTEPQP